MRIIALGSLLLAMLLVPPTAGAQSFLDRSTYCATGLTYCFPGGRELLPGFRFVGDIHPGVAIDLQGVLDVGSASLGQTLTPLVGMELGLYRNIVAIQAAYIGPMSGTAPTDTPFLFRDTSRRVTFTFSFALAASFLGGSLQLGAIFAKFDDRSFEIGTTGTGTTMLYLSFQPANLIRSLIGASAETPSRT